MKNSDRARFLKKNLKMAILGQKQSKNGQKREKSFFLGNRSKDFAENFRINGQKWDNSDGIGGFWSKIQKSGFFGPFLAKNCQKTAKNVKNHFFSKTAPRISLKFSELTDKIRAIWMV